MRELHRLGACSEAIEWVGDRTEIADLWAECERGDWMLWLAARIGVDRRLVVRAAVECARPVVERYCSDPRSAEALRVAIAWCDGTARIEEVRRAAAAADAATHAAAAYAAYAAAYAAYAACAAAYAADAAAASVAASVARASALRDSARTVREIISAEVVIAAMERA